MPCSLCLSVRLCWDLYFWMKYSGIPSKIQRMENDGNKTKNKKSCSLLHFLEGRENTVGFHLLFLEPNKNIWLMRSWSTEMTLVSGGSQIPAYLNQHKPAQFPSSFCIRGLLLSKKLDPRLYTIHRLTFFTTSWSTNG